MGNEIARDKKELENIADMMSEEIKGSEGIVISRYIRTFNDVVTFINGRKKESIYFEASVNKEDIIGIDRGIYSNVSIDDLFPHNFPEITVSRDLNKKRFNFCFKNIEMPAEEETYTESIPSGIDRYDEEFRRVTEDHKNTRISRKFFVEQKVIVNSQGGKVIQTIPFIQIYYEHGYEPVSLCRNIGVVCNTEKDIKRLPELIKYLADPTVDKRIRKSSTFTEAFHELHKISGLKYGSLEEAGIGLSGLYDAIVLNGVPVHEIFGHHFEEPIQYLNFGECGTFRYNQNILNKDIIMSDNPKQEVSGFRVLGFTHVDAYGRKRKPVDHVKDGTVVGFLGSEYFDQENAKKYYNIEKSEAIGNASQGVDNFFPMPRMSCTVLDGKTEDIDLEGKIIIVSDGGGTNDSTKVFQVSSTEAYVIKNGKPQRVIPLQMSGGINQALANMVLLNDFCFESGKCGKPDILSSDPNIKAAVLHSQYARSQMWQGVQVYPKSISDVHLKILYNH